HYAWICWYDCEGDDCSGKVDSYIYYSYNESILSGRRSMISEATTDHPPLTYDWSFHDSGWVFDFDYTYRSVPTWKWQNWQIWTEINQDQFTRIDDAAGITRTQTGTQDIFVSITTNDHYNIPIYDTEFFVNASAGSLQSMVTTDGTVLIANYNDSCLTDTPIYNTTTDGSGYDWQACYYDYLEGFNVKLVFPHLSNESVNISVDNEDPVVSLALADTYIEYNTNQTVAWNVTDNSTIWPPVGYVITQVVYATTGDIFANSSAINGTMELVMNGTLGVYEARVNASDEWNNSNYTFIPFTVGDATMPVINNVTLLVGTPSVTTSVDFYINVTDLLLDNVWVVFDGTDYPASLLGNGWYNTNFTSVNTGTHTYSARANDTSNNIITHNGTLILSYSDAVQQDIRNSSFGLEAVMAILILGALIIPAGLIYVGIKSDNVDPKIYIFGIMTVIGLGILIMIFWIMRASLITAAG
ncbi:MAG: hypothetical protein KAJ19_12545, partial [Gammaproteobacteria bacterium]|nr:hypothetical protein [Gammaproteobacteria bacterium]